MKALFTLFIALGTAAIGYSSFAYIGDELAPFVIEKLPLPHEDLWLGALYVHVPSALFALPACVILSWSRASRFHRWLGRVTGCVVLFALVPSGAYLSLFAKGGFLGTLGFMVSAVITVIAMVLSVRDARARRFASHRLWTAHVLAQLSVAVTSRALLMAFDAATVDPDLAYLVALWLPVVGSYAFVEWKRRPHVRTVARPVIAAAH